MNQKSQPTKPTRSPLSSASALSFYRCFGPRLCRRRSSGIDLLPFHGSVNRALATLLQNHIAMVVSVLRARIAAAAEALQHRESEELHSRISRVHSLAMCASIKDKGSSFSISDLAPLTTEVYSLPWHGKDGEAVVSALLQRPSLDSTATRSRCARRRMQDFLGFTQYFTESEWEDLLSAQVSMESKLNIVVAKLTVLSGRCLSEPTKKLATTFWLTVSDSGGLTCKTTLRKRLSQRLKAMDRSLPAPEVYLEVLPTPRELKSQHPKLFAARFPSEQPIPCKISEKDLLEADSLQQCREADTPSSRTPVLNVGMPQQSALEAFGTLMVKGMEQMQTTQNRVVDLLLGGQGNSRSLGAMQDLRPTPHPAQPRALGNVEMAEHPTGTRQMLALPFMASVAETQGDMVRQAASPAARPRASFEHLPSYQVPDEVKKRRLEMVQIVAEGAQANHGETRPAKRRLVGDVIVDMLNERKVESAEERKAESAKERKAKAESAKIEKAASAKGKAASAKERKAESARAGSAQERKADPKSARPSFAVERTRSQVLCRTGLKGPGNSLAMKYGPSSQYKTENEAREAAAAWMQEKENAIN